MESKSEKAVESFKSGYNCAQSVLSAYSEELNIKPDLAQSITSGFGGGMAKLQHTCGAVTGAFMVMGIYNGNIYSDNNERKVKTMAMIREFNDKFTSIHGTTECKSLIKTDLNTDEGMQYAIENNVFEKICEKCVADSITIIDGILEK